MITAIGWAFAIGVGVGWWLAYDELKRPQTPKESLHAMLEKVRR